MDVVNRPLAGEEDCLYLNVNVPKTDLSKPLPVMVWIYGGAYNMGDKNEEFYGPRLFMNHDVVSKY